MLATRVARLAARRTAAVGPARGLSGARAALKDAGEAGGAAPRVTREMVAREAAEVLKLMVGGVALVGAVFASGGFVIETTRALNQPEVPGQKLRVDSQDGEGVQVHVQTRGVGDTTVIMDGGVGEASFDWDKVAAQVQGFARVVAIDRPGLAYSDATSAPRTSAEIASEYKQVLEKLNVKGKVVLVGHGSGGYNMRELAAELESDPDANCVGLVLVDCLQEHLRGELESVSDKVRESLEAMDKNGETVLWLSRFAIIRLVNYVQHRKFMEKYSPEALPFVMHYSPSPAHRQGVLHESEALPITEQRFRDAAPSASPFEFPCIVLSHGKQEMFNAMKLQAGADDATIEELERKWSDAQDKLAQTVSKRGQRIIVGDAGHAIHHERPDEVARAVRSLVEQARSEQR